MNHVYRAVSLSRFLKIGTNNLKHIRSITIGCPFDVTVEIKGDRSDIMVFEQCKYVQGVDLMPLATCCGNIRAITFGGVVWSSSVEDCTRTRWKTSYEASNRCEKLQLYSLRLDEELVSRRHWQSERANNDGLKGENITALM